MKKRRKRWWSCDWIRYFWGTRCLYISRVDSGSSQQSQKRHHRTGARSGDGAPCIAWGDGMSIGWRAHFDSVREASPWKLQNVTWSQMGH
ncbi:hypothetical protein QG37_04802 [Candidozyma auris]|nr:hypothetical protein QG37_04802 [[Candida] auris]